MNIWKITSNKRKNVMTWNYARTCWIYTFRNISLNLPKAVDLSTAEVSRLQHRSCLYADNVAHWDNQLWLRGDDQLFNLWCRKSADATCHRYILSGVITLWCTRLLPWLIDEWNLTVIVFSLTSLHLPGLSATFSFYFRSHD